MLNLQNALHILLIHSETKGNFDGDAIREKHIFAWQIKSQAPYPGSNGAAYDGHGSTNGYSQPAYGTQPSGNYALTADEYRRQHDLTVAGEGAPDPIQDFASAGFTADILDEVSRPRQNTEHIHSFPSTQLPLAAPLPTPAF